MMKPLGTGDPAAIGSYRLLGILGGGGMGRVYLGESRTGRRVAIKVVRSELAEDPVFRRRFAREVSVARTVNPLFTATVVEADTDAAAPWVATIYIEGPTLGRLVADHGPLASGAVLTLAAGLADALASIHDVGLIHRDIKPSNVIVNDAGPHIIDFGIALLSDTTQTNSLLVGTPSYIAPEIIQGADATEASDVFSLGATLYFAASGRHLVADGSMHAQILQMTRGRFDLGAVPKELRPLIVRCVSPRPADRPTADEIARILVAAGVASPAQGWYLSDAVAPAVPMPRRSFGDGPTPTVAGRTLSRRTVLAGGALGVLAVGSAIAVAAGTFRRPEGLAGPARSASPTTTTTVTGAPTPPSGPGSVQWRARSGLSPLTGTASDRPVGLRIVVDGQQRIITANSGEVYAVDRAGRIQWRTPTAPGLVTLRPWGDAVLVNDTRRMWLLDPAGSPVFTADLVAAEEQASRGDNPDHLAIAISAAVLVPTRAYVGLGTATVALDRRGTQVWRLPRPARRNGIRPPAGTPLAGTDARLLTHDLDGTTVHMELRNGQSRERLWSSEYEPGPPLNPGPPPGQGSGPGGGNRGPGGGSDPSWQRVEGVIGAASVIVRHAHELRAFGLDDGVLRWQHVSSTPVAGLLVTPELAIVAAGEVTAYALGGGAQRWQQPLQGARLGAAPDGATIVAATDQTITALGPAGDVRWRVRTQDLGSEGRVEAVQVTADAAYVTFGAPGERTTPLDVDVVALALR